MVNVDGIEVQPLSPGLPPVIVANWSEGPATGHARADHCDEVEVLPLGSVESIALRVKRESDGKWLSIVVDRKVARAIARNMLEAAL